MKNEYWVHIKNVDNRLVIYLNGETLWDSGIVHDDPEINHFVEITDELKAHPTHTSELIFEGYNDTYKSDEELNPWHFSYRLIKREIDDTGKVVSEEDIMKPYDEKHMSNPNIIAINNCYLIVCKNDEYKVVSYSLTQHFNN
ncbi:MAG: hypothetical protein WBC06_19420 [Chitinophagaceae bacterium]